MHEHFSDGASFSVTGSSAITDIRFDSSVLPVGWSDGTTLLFDLSTGRAPNIMLDKPIRFFGLPDSISIQVKNWGALLVLGAISLIQMPIVILSIQCLLPI